MAQISATIYQNIWENENFLPSFQLVSFTIWTEQHGNVIPQSLLILPHLLDSFQSIVAEQSNSFIS